MASRNRLDDETSPYLRQHRDNPVHWYAWGAEAFAEARDREVPVLLSVGYSACHWCHVMAHECFEDDETAALMNELFVNVKVDREERPDVDALYMEAVQAQTGRGGWPMTVFLDPEGRPLFGGTYYPRDNFQKLLRAVADAWQHRRSELTQNSENLLRALRSSAELRPVSDLPGLTMVNEVLPKLAQAFDPEWGGFGQAPKFPSTHHLELVMRAYMSSRSDSAETVVRTTLDAMASGGMYDHIGGGFARYSTDREWLVPHFEKMLPDQALLARTYLHAFAVFGDDAWSQVASETISYVLRELRHPEGGFFSAEDADSPGPDGAPREGWYHTWTPAEVAEAMGDKAAPAVCEWWGITDEGNFEGRSIPNRLHARGQLRRPTAIEVARARLFAARSRRPRPGLDDKVLTEWNALFLSTLAEATAISGRRDWRAAAIANGEFLLRELRGPDGRWYRSWQADGTPRARHRALAADHAALVDAFTRLGELTGQARWTRAAVETAETMLDLFWDAEHGGLFITPEDVGADEELVVRRKDLHDNATPSANSTAAIALYRLAALTGEQRYANQADRILQLLAAVVPKASAAVSNALIAMEMRQRGLTEIVIVGDRPDLVRLTQVVWRPDAVVAWGEPFDSPLWADRSEGFGYVCRDHVCQLPHDTAEGFFHQITGQEITDRIRAELERVTTDPDG